jgi:hypothetical protein
MPSMGTSMTPTLRSDQQNKLMHSIIAQIAKQAELHGSRWNAESFKRFLIGNHEDWLDQYLTANIPELYDGIEELGTDLTVQGLLNLKDFGYKTVPLNEILTVGHANFIHGYYTGKSHASTHLNVFGCNIYYGHLHDVQSHSSVSIKGVHEGMSLGCLRTLNASFLKGKPNNWSHAFGVFEFRKDGSYSRVVPLIVDGKLSFNGKTYNGNR